MKNKWKIIYFNCRPNKILPILKHQYGKKNVWWPHIRGDKWKKRHNISLLPGYMFVKIDDNCNNDNINTEKQYLNRKYYFLDGCLSDNDIAILQKLEMRSNNKIEIIKITTHFKINDYVTTRAKFVYNGMKMKITGIANEYADMELDFFGKLINLRLPLKLLKYYE
jgi:hypothetical protein